MSVPRRLLTLVWGRYRRQSIVTAALLALWCVFVLASPQTFLSDRIYRSFMSTIPVVAVLSIGLTLLVIAGESDLSFPSVAAAGAYVFAVLYSRNLASAPIAFAAAIAAGAIMGLLNGFLVVAIGVPSMITTIGTQFFWRGAILLLCDGLAVPLASVRNEWLYRLFVGRIGSWEIPAQALWTVLIAAALAVVLNRSRFGDAVLFSGDNRKTAAMMGIRVDRVRIGVFVIAGILSAFAGVLSTLELNNWWPTMGEGYMLLVFASVFVGGTSAYGGEGTIYGTLIGSIIIGIIEAGIISAGLVGFWTRLVHGLIIIASVSVYAIFARKRRSGGTPE